MRPAVGGAVASLLFFVACGSGEPGEIIRTPDERFESIHGFDYEPHCIEITGLRIRYVDEGPRNAMPVLTRPMWRLPGT